MAYTSFMNASWLLVLITTVGLAISHASPASSSPFERSSASSTSDTEINGADASNKLLDARSVSDLFGIGGGSESQSPYYINNRPLSESARYGAIDSAYLALDPYLADYYGASLLSGYPYRRYTNSMAGNMYGAAALPGSGFEVIKSSNTKREDPDAKGQFRLRFGRSGVRLRFGRADPPTLRFG